IRVSGATCGGCARKIQQALETLPGVSLVEVQLPEQLVQVTGSAEPDALLEAIRALNYGAELATPETSEVVEPHEPAEPEPDTPLVSLAITGATCAGCVRKIENALRQVPGVERADVNFGDRTAEVEGRVAPETLIEAVAAAGYGATLIEDEATARAEKEQAEQAHYRKLLRQMWLALGLGIPLMLWGMLGGDMMVHSGASQVAWLIVGVITLAVMYLAGGHFYTGA